jgi:hypothetical protein
LRTLIKGLALLLLSTNLTLSKSPTYNVPKDYENLDACAKQEILWNKVVATQHSELPKFKNFGFFQLIGMSVQQLTKKTKYQSDISPKGWKKYLHRRGSVAKIKLEHIQGHNYTGLFTGAECGLMRLSLTYKPSKKKNVAPGLALKILKDGTPSSNVSALYLLDGQEENHNFFKNPLSNIVPIGTGVGLKLVHSIFARVTKYPEQLMLEDFSKTSSTGNKVEKNISPKHIFFVPNEKLSFSEEDHDVREDFHKIKSGTLLYTIYAVDEKLKSFDYYDYEKDHIKEFLKSATPIAKIVSTSPFISSQFGDSGLFFRHEVHPKK